MPVIAYFHGGGWAIGSIDSFDTVCRALANAACAVVARFGYRLAPEHRFPAAVDDCLAATRWLAATASELGGDGAAGGRRRQRRRQPGRDRGAAAARRGRPAVRYQVLVYPVTDAA